MRLSEINENFKTYCKMDWLNTLINTVSNCNDLKSLNTRDWYGILNKESIEILTKGCRMTQVFKIISPKRWL